MIFNMKFQTKCQNVFLDMVFLSSLETEAEDLFNSDAPPSKKEEGNEILKKIMDEYEVEKIGDTMDKNGTVPESIYFFYGGDSELFNNALEFRLKSN